MLIWFTLWSLYILNPFYFPASEITIKWTQRQLRSENVIISNLTMNFHHNLDNDQSHLSSACQTWKSLSTRDTRESKAEVTDANLLATLAKLNLPK